MTHDLLQLGEHIALLPVMHGSGDFAVEVRRLMLARKFDCLAVPLPVSFQSAVEQGVENLPTVTVAIQEEATRWQDADWQPGRREQQVKRRCSYVPIDPCQPVIAALRIAMQERMPRAYIDLETARYESVGTVLPDAYALKKLGLDRFIGAVLPAIARPTRPQHLARIAHMARRLKSLSERHQSILCLCAFADWPWLREAWQQAESIETPEQEEVEEPTLYRVEPDTLLFLLGELPFITGLYERARADLDDDEHLSIDGIKELLLTSRDAYKTELRGRARRISPHMLRLYLKYTRNLSLIERRMTPDLYTLITAGQQIAGDQFAIHVAETARSYPYNEWLPQGEIEMGIGRAKLPDGSLALMKSRLPGHPVHWRTCQLTPKPPKPKQMEYRMRWNPFSQCSWPPEDNKIETFRSHVKDVALALLGNDLAQTEKFTTSLKDGLDIRETLRNWHTGSLYVKVLPPTRGTLDCVLMFFDSPADPRDYPWRITWHAEHTDESTLALFATDFHQEMVGPGIALATYGGAMFLFPPRPIPEVWRDKRFDFTDTLEERLLAAACHHAEERHIAVLSDSPPGPGWRRLANKHGKRLVHIPMARFSQETIQQMRMFHVLNGQQVRSYAEHFIRKA